MRNKTKLFTNVAFILVALVTVSCSVDKAYDLSKDVDMTVSVAEGFTIPLGSTEKIMLTELLDTLDSDVIKIDKETGFYSIEEKGTIDATEFNVDNTDVEVSPFSDSYRYDLNVNNINEDDLPPFIKDKILETEYAYSLYDRVDKNTVNYEIHQSVPSEIKRIKRMTFKENVKINFDIEVLATDGSKNSNKLIDNVHVYTSGDDEDLFYIEMPSYLQFADNVKMDGNKLYLGEIIERGAESGRKFFSCSFDVVAFDFSKESTGCLEVNDGRLDIIEDNLNANGILWSDTILLAVKDVMQVKGVKITPKVSFSVMKIDSVVGSFTPKIDPVESWVDIDLGDDLDNMNFEFTNPQLFLTVNNGAPVGVKGDIKIRAYKNGAFIENAEVTAHLDVNASAKNKYCLSRLGDGVDGYTTVHIPNLNDLIRTVPDRLHISFAPSVDEKSIGTLQLGSTMSVDGNYRLAVPMEFESFSLEYTERIEDVLGDNPEDITDYISDVNSVTLLLSIDNTVPANFTPSITAYKEDGITKLEGIKVEVSGDIMSGNGYNKGELTKPIRSEVIVKISTTNGELSELSIIDFTIKGSGSGSLNANEYIQIKNISVKIDKPIEVDLN